MKLVKVCGVAWVLFVLVQVARFGYDTKSSWKSTPQAGTGVLLSASSPTFTWVGTATTVQGPVRKTLDRNDAPPVPAPKDHPPLTFVAGANVWHIRYTTAEYMSAAECGAWTDKDTHEVWLSREDEGPHAREVLTHELMHVGRQVARESNPWAGQGFNAADENYFVQPAAPYFQHILRDNKKLAEWISR